MPSLFVSIADFASIAVDLSPGIQRDSAFAFTTDIPPQRIVVAEQLMP